MDTICEHIGIIANLLMALCALIAIYQNRKQLLELKKQYNEDSRARLLIEIVSNRGLFLLKITNVGKETAYNIKLHIQSEMIDNHFSEEIKNRFNKVNTLSTVIVAGESLYYYISPIKETNALHQINNECFKSVEINKWIDTYWNTPIIINGSYCGRFTINEKISIEDFMGTGSIVVVDDSTMALQEISKCLSCKNNIHKPIQENIENINNSLKEICDIIKEEK
jgi:hypothetical protein